MAPTRTVRSKFVAKKTDNGKGSSKSPAKATGVTKARPSKGPTLPSPKQQKTKSQPGPPKKKKRTYTKKELGLPKLNTVIPVGIDRPKGKKKGKIFVDDQESMMTILAIVNANKEGQIESKMMKSRQMEEIREARRKEAEARHERKNSKLEDAKNTVRQMKKRKSKDFVPVDPSNTREGTRQSIQSGKKQVSFA